jgi:hypothetical protein
MNFKSVSNDEMDIPSNNSSNNLTNVTQSQSNNHFLAIEIPFNGSNNPNTHSVTPPMDTPLETPTFSYCKVPNFSLIDNHNDNSSLRTTSAASSSSVTGAASSQYNQPHVFNSINHLINPNPYPVELDGYGYHYNTSNRNSRSNSMESIGYMDDLEMNVENTNDIQQPIKRKLSPKAAANKRAAMNHTPTLFTSAVNNNSTASHPFHSHGYSASSSSSSSSSTASNAFMNYQHHHQHQQQLQQQHYQQQSQQQQQHPQNLFSSNTNNYRLSPIPNNSSSFPTLLLKSNRFESAFSALSSSSSSSSSSSNRNPSPNSISNHIGMSSYYVWDKVGEGIGSDVYQIESLVNKGTFFALKKFKKQIKTQKQQQLLLQELIFMNDLQSYGCPNIPEFYVAWKEESFIYAVLEYASYGTMKSLLEHHVEETYHITIPFIWHLIHNVSSALAFIHNQNIVHLDVKSANLLLYHNAVIKLGDFGLATRCGLTTEDPEGDSR